MKREPTSSGPAASSASRPAPRIAVSATVGALPARALRRRRRGRVADDALDQRVEQPEEAEREAR